jgi:hypothetical protein
LRRAASTVFKLMSAFECRISALWEEMYPIPPMSAASAYTWSMPAVVSMHAPTSRRSPITNSSASVREYSGAFRSTPRTQ